MSKTVRVDVFDESGQLIHNALCRTLHDVAMASQGHRFVLVPPKDWREERDMDREYLSHDNAIALCKESGD